MPARVVLADDHEGVRHMLRLRLQLLNCEVVGEAENGRQAIAQVREHRPDIVVMDLEMPEMNGIDATKEIKKEWPDTVVYGYTALAHADRVDFLLAAGASANFFKDDYSGLIDAISQHPGPRPNHT
ncbi:MAG TPA: response regulator transcription factor [Actinomycetota bacterium]|nr:response regulator transcription factor [Actinomycetota bacterium]